MPLLEAGGSGGRAPAHVSIVGLPQTSSGIADLAQGEAMLTGASVGAAGAAAKICAGFVVSETAASRIFTARVTSNATSRSMLRCGEFSVTGFWRWSES